MEKLKNKIKIVFIVLLTITFMPIFTVISYAKTDITQLSEADLKTLSYYQEPTLEMNFEDNKIWVILKSAYDDLEEISFKYFEVVEEISRISYIWYNLNEFTYEDRIIPLKNGETHHQFEIVLEEHSKAKVLKACNLLNSLDMVLVAEPDYIYDAIDTWIPSDSDYSQQWGLNEAYGIKAEQAWDITRGSTDVKVGLMENNLDMSHEDLDGRAFYGNFTPSTVDEHGTHVAGIIGAKHNTTGIAGVAECSMYLLSRSNFVQSLTYAEENDLKIINASFQFMIDINKSGPTNYKPFNSNHYDALQRYSGLFISAAGNDDNNNDNTHHYPSDYDLPNVICVGSINNYGIKSSFSNYGKNTVDLFAPGENIYSTVPGNSYESWEGTSMAAPFVTGVAALIYAKYPYLSASEVKRVILGSVRDVPGLATYCVTGGTLDAYNALLNANNYHTESYQNKDSNQHDVICGDCGIYIRTVSHTITYQSKDSSQHYATCSDCGYSRTESHTITYQSKDANWHEAKCKDCGTYIRTESHTFTYHSKDSSQHSVTCGACGYSRTESHALSYQGKDSSQHYATCWICGYNQAVSHTKYYKFKDASKHYMYCEDCNMSLGEEAHTFIPYLGKFSTYVVPPSSGKICSGCGFVVYNDGSWIAPQEDEDEIE